MRNKFFFGAFAVLVVLFLFFMFFTRAGKANTVSLPEPILGAPQGPTIAAIPRAVTPVMYLSSVPSLGPQAPNSQNPLPEEEAIPAPPDRPAPGPSDDPANELLNPAGAPVQAPPDGPSYA